MVLKLLEVREASSENVHSSGDVMNMMREEARADRECFWVLHLNAKLHIIEKELVFMGTLESSPVSCREIFKKAIVNCSARIICVHNHPSGDPEPSAADKGCVEMLFSASDIIGIPLDDFIIIGTKGYYSFADQGLIEDYLSKINVKRAK